jgi:ABC-type histidine transport system ATPase subunit
MNDPPPPLLSGVHINRKGTIPAVSLLNLHKSYNGNKVLKGVSLTAQDHDIISIIGSSGSGKSTLLRCINLLEMPDQGEIRIKDELIAIKRTVNFAKPAKMKQIERLRTRLGMVFQNFNLWSHLTVLQNVIEAPIHVKNIPNAEAIEKAEALLHKVGIYNKRHEYPAFLSGGEKQRAAIARALAMEPQVMLFDEPTSALDPERVGEVLKVIRTLAEEGRTMIMVTHEMHFAREVSSEIVYIHEGKIAEQGKPEQVLGNPQTEQCRNFLARHLRPANTIVYTTDGRDDRA